MPESAQPARRLSLGTKMFYGFGSVAYGVKDQGFQTFLLLYYNQVLGMPAIMVTTALMAALLIDAFIDPIIGQLSDSWRSKWGRRHPFMYFSAAPIAISYLILWNPPALSHEAMFFYLIAVAVFVRAFLSTYEIPSASLLPELTEDYDQRTALVSYRYFFGVVGGLAMTVAVFTIFLAPTPEHPVGQLNPDGYRNYSIAAAIVIVASILISAAGTHKLIPSFRIPPARKISLFQTLSEMFSSLNNRSIIVLLGTGVFSGMGVGLSSALGVYLGTYYWGLQSAQFVYLQVAAVIGTVFAVGLATPLTKLMGKKAAAITMFITAVVSLSTPLLLREAGLFPANGHPLLIWLLTLERFVTTIAGVVAGILGASMVADVVEEVEIRTGRRAEGVLTAANTFVNKAVSGFGIFGAGVLLSIVEFPDGAQPGAVPADLLSRFALTEIAALLLLFGLSIACLFGYRVSRSSHSDSLRRLAEAPATPAE